MSFVIWSYLADVMVYTRAFCKIMLFFTSGRFEIFHLVMKFLLSTGHMVICEIKN